MSTDDLYNRDGKAKFDVQTPTGEKFTATPGLYYRQSMDGSDDKPMVWPFIRHYGAHDFYFSLGEPIITVWEKPQWFKPGETKTLDDITVTYRKMTMTGEPGTQSASFGADLAMVISGTTYNVTPHFTVANGPDMPMVGSQLRVAMTRLNAADHSAELQIFFAQPRYPIELFTKPLTGLVWAGTGIMTFGGLLSAFYRRRPKTMRESGAESQEVEQNDPVMDLGKLLEDSGAVLRGHFLLASGRHSDVYFEKFRILEQPQVLSALCQQIAEHYEGAGIQAVAGPTTGGIIIAFEVARLMGLPAVYVEMESGSRALRRNKTLPFGQRILVVDDVLTSGKSLEDTRAALTGAGGKVVGFGTLIDRSNALEFDIPHFSAYKVEAQTFPADALPDWLAKLPLIKPGTSATFS